MQIADKGGRDRRVLVSKLDNRIKRGCVVGCFEVVAQGMAAYCHAVLDHELRFAQGERVTLDGVGAADHDT